MRCHETRELLSLYIDHVLDEDLAAQVSAHLEVCPECRKEYEELVEIIGMLSALPEVPVPEGLETRWRHALEAAEQNRGEVYECVRIARKNRLRRFSAVCAVFVVGIFAVAMYNNSDQWIPAEDAAFNEGAALYAADENLSGAASEDSAAELREKQTAQAAPESPGTSESETANNTPKNENQKTTRSIEDAAGDTKQEGTANQPIHNELPYQEPETHADEDRAAAADPMPSRGSVSGGSKQPVDCGGREGHDPADIRDSMAIRHYMKVLEKELDGTDFEILLCQSLEDGLWSFDVELVSADEEGNQTGSEIVTYYGQDGTIWKKEL